MQGLLGGNLLSKASIFGSSGGSNIKSIQRGSFAWNDTTTTKNIAISKVNKNNSIVKVGFQPSNSLAPAVYTFSGELRGDTNLQVVRESGTDVGTGISFYWEVIEFNNVKSKQDGWVEPATNITTVSVGSSMDKSKTLLSVTFRDKRTSTDNVPFYTNNLLAQLTTDGVYLMSLSLTTLILHWELLEFN